MSGDYGAVAHWRPLRGFWLAAVVAGVALGAVLAANWRYHRRVEREQGWVGAGPACATLSGAAYAARGYRTHERAMDYDGATIARQFGHVMCKDVDTPGRFGFVTHPVCQFTSPGAIRVRQGGIEAFFEPGVGHVATVSLTASGARCTVAGQFTLFSDPTN